MSWSVVPAVVRCVPRMGQGAAPGSLTADRRARLQHAIVDPDRVLLLDVDYSNNSYTLAPDADFPATKLAARWIVWLQDFLTTFAFFS